jgi:hypothetical protein
MKKVFALFVLTLAMMAAVNALAEPLQSSCCTSGCCHQDCCNSDCCK